MHPISDRLRAKHTSNSTLLPSATVISFTGPSSRLRISGIHVPLQTRRLGSLNPYQVGELHGATSEHLAPGRLPELQLPSSSSQAQPQHQPAVWPSSNDNNIPQCGPNTSRRGAMLHLLAGAVGTSLAADLAASPPGANALPLGPLGPVQRVGGEKRTGLSADQIAAVLRRDLAEGQYFVTGDLTREVFADDCRFVDPTNDVTGLSKYLTALGVLFDPQYSKVELLDIRATGPRTVEADWRLGGYLVFPWNPRVEPFTGHTVYTLNSEGLVAEQLQTWSISAATALAESFTPTFGPRRQLF